MLLIDQFEEAFVACRDQAEREAFFDSLVEGAADPAASLIGLVAQAAAVAPLPELDQGRGEQRQAAGL